MTVDDKLVWNKHLGIITAKANSTLGFLQRNIMTKSTSIRSQSYMQLARPVLEYASAAWDSITDTAAGKLEAIQRRGARFVGNLKRTDPTTSVTVFKIPSRSTLYLQPSTTRSRTLRGDDYQYFIPQTISYHHRQSSIIKTAHQWNKLSAYWCFLTLPTVPGQLMQYPIVTVDGWGSYSDDKKPIAGAVRR